MEPVTTFADHAPGLAEAGWSVLPLKTRGKVPLIPHAMGGRGHKDATPMLPGLPAGLGRTRQRTSAGASRRRSS